MIIKDIIREDCINYKKISMLISAPTCNGKCWVEQGLDCNTCQNFSLIEQENIDISNDRIIQMFIENDLEDAIVFGGLEPFEMFEDVLSFVHDFRKKYTMDNDIVIYTGFYENEISAYITMLSLYKNIIIKFGRFIPNDNKRYDEILGVTLSSSNQYSKYISL